MNKSELVEAIAAKTEMSKSDIDSAIGGMFEVASPQGGSLCPLVHARLTT